MQIITIHFHKLYGNLLEPIRPHLEPLWVYLDLFWLHLVLFGPLGNPPNLDVLETNLET